MDNYKINQLEALQKHFIKAYTLLNTVPFSFEEKNDLMPHFKAIHSKVYEILEAERKTTS